MKSLIKQPSETLKKQISFETQAAIGAIVDVASVKRNLIPGSTNLAVAGELTAGMFFVTLAGGTDGESYLVTAKVEDADEQLLEAEIEVTVIDGTWSMPDGGDGYVTIAAFVGFFGLEEVVRMTDAAGDGRIDRPLLISALAAEQSLADAWISNRYQVPLSEVPAVVKTAIADRARARLYPNGAPDGVADAAKAALEILKAIGGGKLPLPGVEAPAEAAAIAPVAVAPGQRQYPDGLRDY